MNKLYLVLFVLLLGFPNFTSKPIKHFYGNLYQDDSAGSQTIDLTTAGTFYALDTLALFIGNKVDTTNAKMIVREAGVYNLTYALSFTGSSNTVYHFGIFVNSVEQINCSMQHGFATALDVINASSTAIVELAKNDTVDIRVSAEADSKTFTYNHVNFVIDCKRN